MTGADYLSLSEAIDGLRRELRSAQARAASLPPAERFRITEAVVELSVAAENTGEAGVEATWLVLKLGAKLAAKDATTHVVRLKLDVGDVEVSSTTTTR